MAPIDIIISIISRKARESHLKRITLYKDKEAWLKELGKLEAYNELIDEFEGFKKLFN